MTEQSAAALQVCEPNDPVPVEVNVNRPSVGVPPPDLATASQVTGDPTGASLGEQLKAVVLLHTTARSALPLLGCQPEPPP